MRVTWRWQISGCIPDGIDRYSYRRSSGRRYLSFGLAPSFYPPTSESPGAFGTLCRIIAKCHLQQRNSQNNRENAHRESPWNAPPNSHDLTTSVLSRGSIGVHELTLPCSSFRIFFLLINAYQWRVHPATVIADGQVFIKPRSARRIYTPEGITNTTVSLTHRWPPCHE